MCTRFFYARELRKFTDKLVYIPYFILPEINPDDQAAIDGMKHFCFTPGTIYANQVIVPVGGHAAGLYQSSYERIRRLQRCRKKYWENKILGLGSPKYDKVACTKKEELEIPKPGWT